MNIIKVLVDELPKNCEQCGHANYGGRIDPFVCSLTRYIILRLVGQSRPSDCPLALEHDNAKIASELV